MNAPPRNARKVGGVPHARNCACPVCDPDDSKCKAARERFLAEQKARAALGVTPPAPAVLAKRAPRFLTPSAETRRMSELLREGKTARQAIEIIEAEKTQAKGTP